MSFSHFGGPLTTGDFNVDGRADLAVGVPYESLTESSEGAVNVIYGSDGGLSPTLGRPDQFLHQ